MRPLAALIALLLGFAALAEAPATRAAGSLASASGEAPAPKRAVQRPLQATKAKPAKPIASPLPVAYAAIARPVRPDPAQCRLGCDRSYYFCEETDDPDQCGGPWTQ